MEGCASLLVPDVSRAQGRNLAIAKWPTGNDPADYVLFIGTECVAVVEAKRSRKNVMAAVDQAGRYSQGFAAKLGQEAHPGAARGRRNPPPRRCGRSPGVY